MGFPEPPRRAILLMGTYSYAERGINTCRKPVRSVGVLKRQEIERALIRNMPLRKIARESKTSAAALFRHKKEQLPALLVKAERAGEVAEASTSLDRVEGLIADLRGIAQTARREKDWPAATGALRETRAYLEQLLRALVWMVNAEIDQMLNGLRHVRAFAAGARLHKPQRQNG